MMKKISIHKIIIFSIIASFLSLCIWGFMIEPNKLILRNETLAVPKWHKEHENIKIAIIADLHAGSPFIDEKKLKKIVEITNSQNPEIVLILGDYIQSVIGGKFIEPEKIAEILQGLKAKRIISVLGNHDWDYNGEKIKNALESHKIIVLENNNKKITINGKIFWIAGLADLWQRKPDLKLALAKTDNNPIILLSHSPDVFPYIPENISLTLSGHTHGGQADLPFIGRPIVPSQYGQRYASGHIIENKKHLFVSNGIGTTCLPARINVPPEIVILKLVPLQNKK